MADVFSGGFLRSGSGVGGLVVSDTSSTAELKRKATQPAGAIDETFSRANNLSNISPLATGVLYVSGAVVIPRGQLASSISVWSGTTAANTPLNQFAALIRMSDLTVLAKSIDLTTTAWGANSKQVFTGLAFTPTQFEVCYVGLAVVATAVPSLIGNTPNSGNIDEAPRYCGASTSGLTTPASLGATAAAVGLSSAGVFYAYVS